MYKTYSAKESFTQISYFIYVASHYINAYYMYIIRLKKKWNKGAPTGACSFYVMRNLWNEIRVILACLALVKVYFLGEVM